MYTHPIAVNCPSRDDRADIAYIAEEYGYSFVTSKKIFLNGYGLDSWAIFYTATLEVNCLSFDLGYEIVKIKELDQRLAEIHDKMIPISGCNCDNMLLMRAGCQCGGQKIFKFFVIVKKRNKRLLI